jgi:hypothetical protein
MTMQDGTQYQVITIVNKKTGETLELTPGDIHEVPCTSDDLLKFSPAEKCYTGSGGLTGISIPTKQVFTGKNTGILVTYHEHQSYRVKFVKFEELEFSDLVAVVSIHID